MNFGAARLGFWFLGQGTGFIPKPKEYDYYYWSSNQLPPQPNTFSQIEFNPNGTITVTYNQVGRIPLYDLPLYWKQNSVPASNYEIRATVKFPTAIDGNGYYQVFGETINTPPIGGSTNWYNLGTQRILRVDLAGDAGLTSYTGLNVRVEIGYAGTANALIINDFTLDIGAV